MRFEHLFEIHGKGYFLANHKKMEKSLSDSLDQNNMAPTGTKFYIKDHKNRHIDPDIAQNRYENRVLQRKLKHLKRIRDHLIPDADGVLVSHDYDFVKETDPDTGYGLWERPDQHSVHIGLTDDIQYEWTHKSPDGKVVSGLSKNRESLASDLADHLRSVHGKPENTHHLFKNLSWWKERPKPGPQSWL